MSPSPSAASGSNTISAPDLPPLYPKQQAAIFDPARYVCIEASTKSGKTAGCIVWILARAWNDGAEGRNYWWVAPVYQQARIAFERLKGLLRQWAKPGPRTWTPREVDLAIDLSTGSRISFRGSDKPDTLYGEDVYAAVIDEASRCKEDAWHAIRSTLTATRGPIRIIGNVRGRQNWAYRMARRAQAGHDGMAYHRLIAADAVAAGILEADEIEDARAQLPDAVFRELYLAEPSDDGGNPFGMAALRACQIPAVASGEPRWFGVDLAKSQDWTVICGLDSEGRVAYLDRFQRDWLATRNAVQKAIGTRTAEIDSTGVGDPIVEDLQRVARNVKGFKFTGPSKQQLMEGLASAVQQGEIRVPDNWLLRELEVFEYQYTRTGVRYSAPEGLHDDGVCALALAIRAKRLGTAADLGIRLIGNEPHDEQIVSETSDIGWNRF